MSERSDHLIERAAARLRGEAIPRMPVAPPQQAPALGIIAFQPPKPVAEPVPPPTFTPISLPSAPTDVAPPAPITLPQNVAQILRHEDPPEPVANPAPRFEPFTIPAAAPRPAAAPHPGPATRAMFGAGDAVPENVDGPIPPPSAPLTRPVMMQVPPTLKLNTGQHAPLAIAPANSMLLADQPVRPAGPVALQAPAIVQLDALERAGMVVARTTRTRISEEYRIAIGRILRTLHETPDIQGARNVMMVTSARPGEGKSFTALNLAGSIAQNGTDAVLLVDVDPKVKPLSDQLGLGDAHGFLDLVSDPSLRPEDLLRVTAIPNLAIMPVGTRLGGAAQTVGGTASMRPIIPTITRLARRFPKHLIMLDAPPCLSTSDPHTLAPHVGQVVLVVEAERTQRSEVEAALDLVRVCPSITLLLNKVRMTTSHTFGAYDYFGSYT